MPRYTDDMYREVGEFVTSLVMQRVETEDSRTDILRHVGQQFSLDDLTDPGLNRCIDDHIALSCGDEVTAASSYTRNMQAQTQYARIFNTGAVQNRLLAFSLTQLKDGLEIDKAVKDLSFVQGRKLFDQFPQYKNKLPKKIRDFLYPPVSKIVAPVIMYGLLNEDQQKAFRDKAESLLPWNKKKNA